MAHAAKVLESVESPCGLRCVDIVHAPDERYGWARYRRDPEDGHGWRPDGWGEAGFRSAAEARAAAEAENGWMADAP